MGGKKKTCNNIAGKCAAVFIPALVPFQLGGCVPPQSTAMAGMQQGVDAGRVLGGLLINSGLPCQSYGNWHIQGAETEQAPPKKGFYKWWVH